MLCTDPIHLSDPLVFQWVFGKDSELCKELLERILGKSIDRVSFDGSVDIRANSSQFGRAYAVSLCAPERSDRPQDILRETPVFTMYVYFAQPGYRERYSPMLNCVTGTSSLVICTNYYDPFNLRRPWYYVRMDGARSDGHKEDLPLNVIVCPHGQCDEEHASLAPLLWYFNGEKTYEELNDEFVTRVHGRMQAILDDPQFTRQHKLILEWQQEASDEGKREGYDKGYADGHKSGRLDGIGDGYLDGLNRRAEQLRELDQRLRNAGRSSKADQIQRFKAEVDGLIKQFGLN